MKTLKKLLFSMLLLCVGVLTVSADDAPPTNINVWKSLVSDISANAGALNNCSASIGAESLDTFIVKNECVATAISTVETYLLVGRAGNPDGGETYHGAIVESANDTSNTDILLSEIVELIYNDSSKTTQKLKKFAMDQDRAAGSAKYILKAGSSDNALYIYGGYEGKAMSGMKMPICYAVEMFIDRVCASKNYQGDNYKDDSALCYYERGKDHYLLHPDTRALLEYLLTMLAVKGEKETYSYVKRRVLKNKVPYQKRRLDALKNALHVTM